MSAPEWGTPEFDWWAKGAEEEARLNREGMTSDGRQAYEYAQVLARQGDSAARIGELTARVFLAGQPFMRRLRLAWKLVRG